MTPLLFSPTKGAPFPRAGKMTLYPFSLRNWQLKRALFEFGVSMVFQDEAVPGGQPNQLP